MKNMQFLEIMNSIDEEILLEADEAVPQKLPKSVLIKRMTAAACMAVLSAGIAVTLQQSHQNPPKSD